MFEKIRELKSLAEKAAKVADLVEELKKKDLDADGKKDLEELQGYAVSAFEHIKGAKADLEAAEKLIELHVKNAIEELK